MPGPARPRWTAAPDRSLQNPNGLAEVARASMGVAGEQGPSAHYETSAQQRAMQRPGGVNFARGARSDVIQPAPVNEHHPTPTAYMAGGGSNPFSWANPTPLRAETEWLEGEHKKFRPDAASSKARVRQERPPIPSASDKEAGEPLRNPRSQFIPPDLPAAFKERDPWFNGQDLWDHENQGLTYASGPWQEA